MKINNISTELTDGINEKSVWSGFYIIFEVQDEKGNVFNLQYIAANSILTERDYENPTDHEKLEENYQGFLCMIDEIADQISELTLNIEISKHKIEEYKEKLEEIMDV